MAVKNKVKVKFLQSPSFEPFLLAYNAGELAEVDKNLALQMIEKKIAIEVKPEKVQATKKPATKGK